jgi:hypothetical protein
VVAGKYEWLGHLEFGIGNFLDARRAWLTSLRLWPWRGRLLIGLLLTMLPEQSIRGLRGIYRWFRAPFRYV